MADPQITLEPGNFYHIYNRGINSCNLFRKPDNYEHFLELYDKYISPVADTYAWVLMPNHFHLLVRVRENVVYKYSNADRSVDAVRFEEKNGKPHRFPTCQRAKHLTASLHQTTKFPKPIFISPICLTHTANTSTLIPVAMDPSSNAASSGRR